MKVPTNRELAELLDLEGAVKVMNKRIAEIKESCRVCGSFNTDQFLVAVTTHERRGLLGVAEVEGILGRDLVMESGLIKTSIYQIVRVSMIGVNG